MEVRAISVNPVDAKIRSGGGPGRPDGQLQILGWDAAGVVTAVGDSVNTFKPGDEVYYAGDVDRPGSYAQFQCVDERLVGRKPASIGFAEAAALPLTTITAWESLFDRMKIRRDQVQHRLASDHWRRGRCGLHRHAIGPPPDRAHRHCDRLAS